MRFNTIFTNIEAKLIPAKRIAFSSARKRANGSAETPSITTISESKTMYSGCSLNSIALAIG